MAEVVGVVFPSGMKVYHFDPAGLELAEGDRVVVQTSSGPEIGEVVEPPHEVDDSEVAAALKKVQRVATDKDLESQAASASLLREAMTTCRELIRSHGLDMKLVGAEMGFGGDKITFSFFSEERVDFRALVTDLAKTLGMRIELRQVGAREEARMVGGLGPCGRPLCCTVFQGDDDPVSIRMAKEQNLPLNPAKISGLCGRLMCCLKYEQDQYVSFRKESPSKGTRVCTPTGDGVVTGYMLTKESVAVKMEDGSHGEVRLSECERQKDGSLVFTPEEKPPPPSPWDFPIGERRSTAGESAEIAQAKTEGAGSATDSDGSAEDKRGGTQPSRSRKSRSKRRSRGSRGQGQSKGQGQGQAQGQPGGKASGAESDGQQAANRARSDQKKSSGQNGAGQQNSGQSSGARRARRRRKPRKPGGTAGGASNNAGAGASGGGNSSGGSGGGAGS